MATEDDFETMNLDEFLRSRHLPEKIIQRFADEKIDRAAIKAMSDSELKDYLPAHGDRLAVKSFCNKIRRTSLIEKLKQSFNSKGEKTGEPKKTRNLTVGKETRVIEVAWQLYCEKTNTFKRVRGPIGGNRRISIKKICKSDDIKSKAIELFFPDGVSTHGNINDFESELLDYKGHKIQEDLDIGEMYSRTGMTSLRFYLSTTKKNKNEESENFTPLQSGTIEVSSFSMDLRPRGESSTSSRVVGNGSIDDIGHILDGYFSEQPSTTTSQSLQVLYECFSDDDARDEVILVSSPPPNESDRTELRGAVKYKKLPVPTKSQINRISVSLQESYLEESGFPEIVLLHRGNVFQELLNFVKIHLRSSFKNIQIEMLLPNGTSEKAEDFGGVLRDALTEFWETFYSKCTLGINFKVPVLRHDLQKEEWCAIGKICVEGYLAVGYFPIKLAPTFINYCFEKLSDEQEILNDFFKYISDSEAVNLDKAINNFEDVDQDELIDFLSQYNSKWLPNKNNVKTLILQIASEELIQKPSFVKECFFTEFKILTQHITNLREMYCKLEPTSKNIINLFDVSHIFLDQPKMEIYRYLTKFIKTADESIRSAFMRFCTGSNLVIGKSIKIDFIDSDGFQRSPIAHTCSGLLQIPLTYQDFVSFREEFTHLLNSSIWVMDII